MPSLDVLKFRTGLGEDPAGEEDGRSLESARFRAHGTDVANESEPLPEDNENSLSSGLIVDDDYRTRVDHYCQFYRMPYETEINYQWPDLAWKWIKHPYYIRKADIGPYVGVSSAPPTEIYITERGPFWKYKYQRGFESSDAIKLLPVSSFAQRYIYTTMVKFIWAGGTAGSYWSGTQYGSHGLTADGWSANSGPGPYVVGITGELPATSGPSPQQAGYLFVGFKYGSFDAGAPDTQTLTQFFYYPVTSVLDPDLAWDSQELSEDNGIAGKYTFVISCDGTNTKVGMIPGHSGGEIEWFGEMTPFSYDSGTIGTGTGTAIAKYLPPRTFGGWDYGGFLGSSYANWSGWIREVATSTVPYDTLLGELGNLRPYYGYLHLDHVKIRNHA